MRALQVLQWVRNQELPTGGIDAWCGYGKAYPEVTGYLLPTLLKYGEVAMVKRLADWLLTTQNMTGGFPGLDGGLHTFDTAAIMEGLQEAYMETHRVEYIGAATRARQWLWSMRRCNGTLMKNNTTGDSALYTARASMIIGDKEGVGYWMPVDGWPACWGERQRSHYIAYALEGLWRMGEKASVRMALGGLRDAVVDGLMPFWVNNRWQAAGGIDYCATVQMALLYHLADMDADPLLDMIDGLVCDDGGIEQGSGDHRKIAWAAKYYLDLCKEVEG